MRAYLADLTAKSSREGALDGSSRRLFGRQSLVLYGIAAVAVALALAGRALLGPILQDQAPYLFFVPAILVAAGIGGFGSGVLATVLSLSLCFIFIPDFPGLSLPEFINAGAFVAIGLGMAWGGEQLRRNRLRASASTQSAPGPEAPRHLIHDQVPLRM